MRNIRLYIGGQRVDLDSSVNIPFTYQTSDAEMPTSVKNSYSKTVSLKGTDRNSRVFGGIWHLDSRVVKEIPGTAGTPAVYGPWNQLVNHGNFDTTTGWTRYNSSTMSFSVSDNVGIVNITGNQRQPLMYRTFNMADGHKFYYAHTLRITAATARNFRTGRLYTPNQYFQNTAFSTNQFTSWRKVSGVITANSAKTRMYVGFYGQTTSDVLAAGDKLEIKNCMLIDLTDVYGAGNEPTAAQFEAENPELYYDYAPIGSQREITPAQPGTPAQRGNIGIFFDPMKRVPFQLYVDEMVVERGYCQLTAITRKGRDYTFSVSLFGGLGEFFYNLQTGSDGESRKLSDLDFGSDLGFKINAAHVQQVWDDMIGGTLPTVGFVPMHNGVPKNIDADKVLVKGGGIPATVTDGGNTYSAKDGYLLASAERKYTEWEIGDLRSYLQRPALRLKDFFSAVFNPSNNGGWTVVADPLWFDSSNPYYENTYILLPQLNVEESTDDVCDDGTVTPFSDYPATSTKVSTLGLNSGCMTIVSDYVDMSAQASNAYLSLSLPVQLALTGVSARGPLYMTNRVSHHTENKTICMMAAAYDDQNNLLAVSNRYVFTSKSHRNETGDVKKPAAPVSTTDAQIDGYFDYDYDANEYRFRLDENPADTFALLIEKIQRPSSALHRVQVKFYIQMTADGIPTVNRWRYGDNLGNVYVNNTQFQCRILSGSNNSLKLVEPTQYSSDSQVSQTALLNSLDVTPLDLLLSVTKTFGLMWLQDNQENTVRLMQRPTYYTGEVRDIHDRIDYSKGLKVTPVSAESNNYVLANEYPETDLSEAYKSDYGRTYGEVRLNVGYDFGKDKVEMMEKVKLLGYVDGALSGAGYWSYHNADGNIPSVISGGIKVTYYHDSGGTTDTKDIDYNLFNVSALDKRNSIPLGVACQNDDGEEKGEEVAPSLVFLSGGKADGTYYLSDDISAMATLNNGPCWIWDESRTPARIPKFGRVATFSGETYSLDFGTPRMTYYIPEVSLAPEQAIYHRYWEKYLTDLLSRDTKKVEAYVIFPPHLDMREEMRKFYLFDRTLWVLNKVTDYDATKTQSVKCEFIRVNLKDSYTSY